MNPFEYFQYALTMKTVMLDFGSKMTVVPNPAFDEPDLTYWHERYLAISSAMVLFKNKTITEEELVGLNDLIMSVDHENITVAQTIINNLKPE